MSVRRGLAAAFAVAAATVLTALALGAAATAPVLAGVLVWLLAIALLWLASQR